MPSASLYAAAQRQQSYSTLEFLPTFHVSFSLVNDKGVRVTLALPVLDYPDALYCAVHLKLALQVLLCCLSGQAGDEEGFVWVAYSFRVVLWSV